MINFVVNSTKNHTQNKSTNVISKKETIVIYYGGNAMVIDKILLSVVEIVCLFFKASVQRASSFFSSVFRDKIAGLFLPANLLQPNMAHLVHSKVVGFSSFLLQEKIRNQNIYK